jgi:hypothetical protein
LYFLDRGNKELIHGDVTISLENVRLSTILELVQGNGSHSIFVVGGDNAANSISREWLNEVVSYGWTITDQHKDRKLIICKRDKQKITLYASSLWFANIPDGHTAKSAYKQLGNVLRDEFKLPQFELMSTPTKAGKDLILRTLPFKADYPVLAEKEMRQLHAIAYQGRLETFSTLQIDLQDIYCLDGTFMYAACLARLPVGICVHDSPSPEPNTDDRYIPAFYLATFTVPANWYHIGLIKRPKERHESPDAQSYPNTPGTIITNWVSYEEMYLAIRHGWKVEIHERIIWPETHRTPDPLATWIKHMRLIRTSGKQGKYGDLSPYVADGVRAMTLGPVGAFNRHYAFERHSVPTSEANKVPQGAPFQLVGTRVDYWLKHELPVTKWSHPEWSLCVWGRARAKIASMALQLPYDSLLALRTDGIWVNRKPDEYDSRGNLIESNDSERGGKLLTPGSWRVKEEYHRQVQSPQTNAQFVRVMQDLREAKADEVNEWETESE